MASAGQRQGRPTPGRRRRRPRAGRAARAGRRAARSRRGPRSRARARPPPAGRSVSSARDSQTADERASRTRTSSGPRTDHAPAIVTEAIGGVLPRPVLLERCPLAGPARPPAGRGRRGGARSADRRGRTGACRGAGPRRAARGRPRRARSRRPCRRAPADALAASVSCLGARDEQAEDLLGTAADPAAQLVELGEAEAVGLLDDHDRRVRDVDADLDHGRRHEHASAVLKGAHHLVPLGRLQLPCRMPMRSPGSSARRALGPPRRRARSRSLPRSADRRRTPVARVSARAAVDARRARSSPTTGDDRLADAGGFASETAEVAVDRSARACAGSASPSCAGRAASALGERALLAPKRCCSSTTATPRSRTRPALDQGVRADAIGASRRERWRGGLAPAGRSAARGARRARAQTLNARKCCSASVSVGAISAICGPALTARRSARARRPSCPSRRRPAAAAASGRHPQVALRRRSPPPGARSASNGSASR